MHTSGCIDGAPQQTQRILASMDLSYLFRLRLYQATDLPSVELESSVANQVVNDPIVK